VEPEVEPAAAGDAGSPRVLTGAAVGTVIRSACRWVQSEASGQQAQQAGHGDRRLRPDPPGQGARGHDAQALRGEHAALGGREPVPLPGRRQRPDEGGRGGQLVRAADAGQSPQQQYHRERRAEQAEAGRRTAWPASPSAAAGLRA
jgi:hypothetical protein